MKFSRKIISYSLFGTDEKYSQGALRNCKTILKLLPEWTPRIYYASSEFNYPKSLLSQLQQLGAELVDVTDWLICGKSVLVIPYLWRCFAFFNSDMVLSRDLDSPISEREVEYINKWVSSEKLYFIIRDHPWQGEIGAGLLGINNHPQTFNKAFLNYINNNSEFPWGYDEVCLRQFKEKYISSENSYVCSFETLETYIPRTDKSTFIGIQCNAIGQPSEPGQKALAYLSELNL